MTVSPTASEARRREQLQRRAVAPTPCCVALALPASADAVELAVDRSGAGRPPGGGVAGGGGGGGEQCQQAREQQHCARRRGAKLSRVPPALGAATAWASGRRLRACRLRIVCGPQAARRRSPPLHDGRWTHDRMPMAGPALSYRYSSEYNILEIEYIHVILKYRTTVNLYPVNTTI